MPLTVGRHRRVRFASSQPAQIAREKKRPGKRPASSHPAENMASQELPRPGIPALFTQPPPIRDPLVTETIDLQDATLKKCLPFLKGIHSTQKGPFNACGVPALQRDDHVAYLYDSLEDYPAGFVAMDASRPWMVYWALAGLSLLGEDVTRVRQR
jgi:protein farnesyltransferase subunit beta